MKNIEKYNLHKTEKYESFSLFKFTYPCARVDSMKIMESLKSC